MEPTIDTESYKKLIRADIDLLNSFRLFGNGSKIEQETFKRDIERTIEIYKDVYNELENNQNIVTDITPIQKEILRTCKSLKKDNDYTLESLTEALFVGKFKKNFLNREINAMDKLSLNLGGMLSSYEGYKEYKVEDEEFEILMNDIFQTLTYYLKIEQIDKALFNEINEAVKTKTDFNSILLYDSFVAYNNLMVEEYYSKDLPVTITSKENDMTLEELISIMDVEKPGYDINNIIDYFNKKYMISVYDKKNSKKMNVMASLTRDESILYDEDDYSKTK